MQGGAKVEVSREALEEADALLSRRPKVVVPMRQRIRQAVILGLVGSAAALVLGAIWWIRSGQQNLVNLEQVVRQGEADTKANKEYPSRAKAIYNLVSVSVLTPYSNDVNTYPKKYTDLALADFRLEKQTAGGMRKLWLPLIPLKGQ